MPEKRVIRLNKRGRGYKEVLRSTEMNYSQKNSLLRVDSSLASNRMSQTALADFNDVKMKQDDEDEIVAYGEVKVKPRRNRPQVVAPVKATLQSQSMTRRKN